MGLLFWKKKKKVMPEFVDDRKRKTLVENFDELAKEGDIEALKAVFEQCDVNAYGGYYKGTAFSFGIPKELMVWLLEQGANIDKNDAFGDTPLSRHAGGKRDSQYVKWLIELGADLEATDDSGNTALHQAAASFCVENVKSLVAAGADVRVTNKDENTPLEKALLNCAPIDLPQMTEIAFYLLEHGAVKSEKAKTYVTKIGEKVERFRSKIVGIEETELALNQLYELFKVVPVSQKQLYDGKAQIIVAPGRWQKQYQKLWDLLVPASGAASTVQGEVVRLAGRLSNEILDNGSINWDADFEKMADAVPKYIRMGNLLEEELAKEMDRLAAEVRTGNGMQEVERLTELCVAWVVKNPDPIPLKKTDYKR